MSENEKRSSLLGFWIIFIAVLSLISAMLGVFMGTYQVEMTRSPYNPSNSFENFYLFIEICQYLDIVLTFFTDFHDEEKDIQVREF